MNELERLLAIFGTTHGASNRDVFERVTNALLAGASQLETTQGTLEQLRNAAQRQADAVEENTAAVRENTATRPTGLTGFAADAVKTAGRLLGSGFALSPILSGLVGLLRSTSPEPVPALPRYVAPTPFRFQGAGPQTPKEPILEADYEQSGLARKVFQPPVQVAIHIQAIDSRSFVDHRDEIARAVREAMLSAHGLNDVMTEL
jgi:hypothetical protein